MIAQLIYFALISLGLGFALWRLLGIREEDDMAAFFLYAASGIAAFTLLAVPLGFIGLASWQAYGAITLAAIVLAASRGPVSFRMPKIGKEWAIVLLLFLVHLYVYATGAFSYPWLEDDDPWEHASAVRYVSIFSTYIQPEHLPMHYLAPYTPFFDVLLGTLFQLDGSSMQFTLKFFNALLVSLALPLFYCWAKRRFDGRMALWATAILTVLPCFMSHFIWAQTLAMMLVFPALYFFDRAKEGRWHAVAAVGAMAAMMVTQSSAAAMFGGLMAAYIAAGVLAEALSGKGIDRKNITADASVLIAGVVLAILLFWAPMFVLYSPEQVLSKLSLTTTLITDRYGDTGGGLIYGFSDFFTAPFSSKMDQPVGFGEMAAVLLVIGIVAAALDVKERKYGAALVLLLWFAYGMIGTEGNVLPAKLVPHRFWVFLAIPVALLAGLGAVRLVDRAGKNWGGTVAGLVILGLVISSASAKYVVETSAWPPGASWVSNEQISGYIGLKNLSANTKVFSFCGKEDMANGMDKFGYAWVKEVTDYKVQSINDSVEGNYAFLKRYGYEYTLVDQGCLKDFAPEQINSKLNALASDSRFAVQQQLSNQAFIVFKVD